ncbi:MAG: hypothetical protein HS103_19515 [Anaerolineales bacterium]|nr:hypothetical protein [Anaerolineales bacterium]
MPKHAQAKQYRSELVTIGVLVALKGGCFRAFFRWLVRDSMGCSADCRIALIPILKPSSLCGCHVQRAARTQSHFTAGG